MTDRFYQPESSRATHNTTVASRSGSSGVRRVLPWARLACYFVLGLLDFLYLPSRDVAHDVVHFTDGLEVKATDDRRDRIVSGQLARVPDGIDDARVAAAAENHSPRSPRLTTSA
jgi:hypothetical protein